MNREVIQWIALYMITLVIGLPVYSAEVMAGISYIEAKGSDELNNIIRDKDAIKFKAVFSNTEGEDINPDNVWLGENYVFLHCFKGNYSTECEFRYPASGTTYFAPRSLPYTINLKDDKGKIIDSKSDTLYVDGIPPTITKVEAANTTVANSSLEIGFYVVDYACTDPSCASGCSGIKRIDLYTNDGAVNKNLTINTVECKYSGKMTIDPSGFPEGELLVFLRAYDMLGYASEVKSLRINIDRTAPVIKTETFKVLDTSGEEMIYAGPNGFSGVFYIEIEGADLDASTVAGDFSSLDPNKKNITADCTLDGNLAKCRWNINVRMSESETKNFVITANDEAGNSATADVSYSFQIDKTGPKVTAIETAVKEDSEFYAKGGSGNKFTAKITESESGLNAGNVILHVGSRTFSASSCTEGWTCEWDDVDVGTSNTQASIGTDTTDRAGNAAEGMSIDVKVDATVPQLLSFEVQNTGGTDAALEGIFKTGDALAVVAEISSESIGKAEIDFSSYVTGETEVAGDCSSIGTNKWRCSFVSSPIDITGFIDANIKLTVSDFVGNTLTHEENVQVFGVIDGLSNFWETTVTCSPRLIDRETTTLINQKVFCNVHLSEVASNNVIPLKTNLIGCNVNSAFQEINIFNNGEGSIDPYIGFILKKSEFKVDNLDVNCTLAIISKVGNEITGQPEEENISTVFEFYNQPLGELSESVLSKMKEAVDDATNWRSYISWLNKIRHYAELACKVLNIWHNIVQTWQGITTMLGEAEKIWKGTPAGAGLTAKRMSYCGVTEKTAGEANDKERFGDKFCKIVNCQYNWDTSGKYTGYLGKWQEKFLGEMKGSVRQEGGWLGQAGGDYLEKWTGKELVEYMDPAHSLPVGIMFACIPGIIYGIEKWRQIDCMYAKCLYEGVAQQGLPLIACDDQKGYAQCKYVLGEVFNVIPLTALFDYYADMVKDVFSNPFKVLGAGLAAMCSHHCSDPTSEKAHTLCRVVKVISMIGQAIGDVTSIFKGGLEIQNDFCEGMDEIEQFVEAEEGGGSIDPNSESTTDDDETEPEEDEEEG